MTWQFVPYESFGPLTFGMSQAEALQLLGPPEEEYNVFSRQRPYIDPKILGDKYIQYLKRSTGIFFSDSDRNIQYPELIFLDDALANIHIRRMSGTLLVSGVDVLGEDRVKIILELSKNEEVMLFTGADYYFESIGVRISAPKFWKKEGSISLYSKAGFEKEMFMAEPYEYAPEEITGRES